MRKWCSPRSIKTNQATSDSLSHHLNAFQKVTILLSMSWPNCLSIKPKHNFLITFFLHFLDRVFSLALWSSCRSTWPLWIALQHCFKKVFAICRIVSKSHPLSVIDLPLKDYVLLSFVCSESCLLCCCQIAGPRCRYRSDLPALLLDYGLLSITTIVVHTVMICLPLSFFLGLCWCVAVVVVCLSVCECGL
jgi:hypothetical protein